LLPLRLSAVVIVVLRVFVSARKARSEKEQLPQPRRVACAQKSEDVDMRRPTYYVVQKLPCFFCL
jgi:hypothetical protein